MISRRILFQMWAVLLMGTLFFHHVTSKDFQSDMHFTCCAENTELKDYKFGNKFTINVTSNKRRSLTTVAPAEQYVNQSAPVALQGTYHKLHCFFSGYPQPKPTWYHNGNEINEDTNPNYRFEAFGKTLVFNVSLERQGRYDCRFPMYQDLDRSFNVQVEAAPYWPDGPPPNTNTSEGETVVFNCRTNGKPTPTVTFYKNGVEMPRVPPAGSKEHYSISNSELTIFDVKKGIHGSGDNAVYQCKAENKHGYIWTNFYLNLLAFKPQLLTDPGEVEQVTGRDVTLECKFFGSPNAKVEWTGAPLQGAKYDIIPTNAHGVGKLILKNVSSASEGEYMCTGKNKYGTASGTAKLQVRKATVMIPFESARQTHVAGGVIELPCEAQTDDRLDVSYEWRRDGRPLDQYQLDSGHYVVEDGGHKLKVNQPLDYDSGKYTCIAKTKLDEVEQSVNVIVRDVPPAPHAAGVSSCSPDQLTAEVTFEHLEDSETTAPVKEFWVEYQIDGQREGGQWRTNPVAVEAKEEIIENSHRKTTGKATISLQPFGQYAFRVFARNLIGNSAPTIAKSGCATPAKLPYGNPSNVSAKGASPENLVVSWQPMPREDWNGPNFHYKIKYRPKDSADEEWKEVDVKDPYASKYTITLDEDGEAKPYQPYLVQVQAVNDEGISSVTPEILEGFSGEGIPTAKVEGFRLKSKSGSSASFEWSPVDESTVNGRFKGYKITYWATDDSEEEDDEDEKTYRWKRDAGVELLRRSRREENPTPIGEKKTLIVGSEENMAEVYDLTPDTVNHAYVTVINGAHEGPKSDEIEFRTDEGVPTPVRSLAAYPMNGRTSKEKGVVHVRWSSPKQSNGRLTGYQVEYCRTEADGRRTSSDCRKQILPLKQKELRITNLEHEAKYRFIVRASTTAGVGDPNSQDATTLPEVTAAGVEPEVPDVRVNQIDDHGFNVSFVPGAFDEEMRKPIGNFLAVQYRKPDSDSWEEIMPEGDTLSVAVDELEPGTKYDVRSVAVERDESGEERRSFSPITHVTTTGRSPRSARLWLILLILLILLLIICIACIICVACRHRGENYPVSQREREQGREPILGKQHFGEYKNEDEEKRSLTGSKAESETDSMAEYGDTDPGRFTEDGSFIGQYVPNKTLIAQGEPTKGSTSTFV